MTWITPFGPVSKSFLEKLVEKLALTIPVRLTRDLAQPQLRDEPGIAGREKQNVFLDRWRKIQQNHDLSKARRGDVPQPG